MNILVINCGSSSFKYQLIEMDNESVLASGLVERIGEPMGKLIHKKHPQMPTEKKISEDKYFKNHREGLQTVLELLTDKEAGVLSSIEEITAVGHRVVQGGELLSESCIVTEKVKEDIKSLIPLAPLHNAAHLQGIEIAQEMCPHAPSVTVFDTEFHSTMPQEAYLYPLPYKLYEDMSIRRYGFHGTSHYHVSKEAANFLNRPLEELNLITCHLGNGSSIAAVSGGKCIYTSMGLTPLAGLMMGTRCGDIDPAVVTFLARHKNIGPDALDNLMNKESGLKGICGLNDMRDVHAAREDKVHPNHDKAELAFSMFCHSLKRQIGACYSLLGTGNGVDAIIFTAGIGENDAQTRSNTCKGLAHMGILLDEEANKIQASVTRSISQADSHVRVLVIPTNEELEIARATKRIIKAAKA